jgi:hypothetical protein
MIHIERARVEILEAKIDCPAFVLSITTGSDAGCVQIVSFPPALDKLLTAFTFLLMRLAHRFTFLY